MTESEVISLSDLSPEVRSLIVEEIVRTMAPHQQRAFQSLERTTRLLVFCIDDLKKQRKRRHLMDDILRATVVLMHSAIEDLLKSVAAAALPYASEAVLDGVPLVGSPGHRADKFLLGKLARHRGKRVDDVIRELGVSRFFGHRL